MYIPPLVVFRGAKIGGFINMMQFYFNFFLFTSYSIWNLILGN